MAIGTDAAIEFFELTGEVTEISSSEANVLDTAFSTSGIAWTNTDDSKEATIILSSISAGTFDANGPVHLYARRLNVAGTGGDEAVPSANAKHGYMTTFLLENNGARRYFSRRVKLDNSKEQQEYEFYIENQAGATLGNAATAYWQMFVQSVADGPHA